MHGNENRKNIWEHRTCHNLVFLKPPRLTYLPNSELVTITAPVGHMAPGCRPASAAMDGRFICVICLFPRCLVMLAISAVWKLAGWWW